MTSFSSTTDSDRATEACPACDKPVNSVEKRQLPLDATTFPDGACIVDSDALSATVSVTVHHDLRPDVAVVTHTTARSRE